MAYQVKVQNGALDMHNKSVILRGVIDPSSFDRIQVASYQRERRTLPKLKGMIAAIKAGEQMPDIEIGVRGENYNERDGCFYLHDDCYTVDGLQRLTACQRVIAENPSVNVRLGAMFHFNTTEKWEKDRFRAVNAGDGGRIAVSPNILLRNSADECKTVDALMKMSASDKEFVLRGKVSWGQNKGRGELLTALSVLKVSGHLHSHFGPGRSTKYTELMKACDKTLLIVGPNIWRANTREFYAVIDRTFGISKIAYADLINHIKFGFLRVLAQVFADHANFWEGTKLTVSRRDEDKLRQFAIGDPAVSGLISAGGGVNPVLYQILVAHLNSGRRTNRLVKWNGQPADGAMSMNANTDEEIDSDFSDSGAMELTPT